MSTRVDLFPKCYTDKLAMLQDDLPPMDAELAKAVVRQARVLCEYVSVYKLLCTFARVHACECVCCERTVSTLLAIRRGS